MMRKNSVDSWRFKDMADDLILVFLDYYDLHFFWFVYFQKSIDTLALSQRTI